MPHDRFFLDASLVKGEKIFLKDEEAHHAKVMRVKEKEEVEVVNGKNQLAKAVVLSIGKKEVILQINDVQTKLPSFPTILCQAICRLNRLDTIIEKGTELGVTEFWLFPGELSEKKELSETQIKRLQTILISALKQSGRLDLPLIQIKPPLKQWTSLPYPAYFGDVHPEAPLFSSLWEKKEGVVFFVGPESGFTNQEESFLKDNLRARGVKLHSNVLRTDTAPLVALSLIQHWILS